MTAIPSAREWREQARSSEAQASRLAVLERVAEALAGGSTARETLTEALAVLVRHHAADAGLVLAARAGALTVLASVGAGLPVGASLPAGGAWAPLLHAAPQAVFRERLTSRLRLGASTVAHHEWLLPLTLTGRSLGALALLGGADSPRPDAAEQRLFAAAATLLAGAVATAQAPRPKRPAAIATATMTRLTAREQQVLGLLPSGASNAEIAARLGIAPGTAKSHVERILHKLGVRDRTAAAVLAAGQGLPS